MRRLMVAAIVLGSVVAARSLQTKGTQTAMAHNDAIAEMTEAIRARLTAQWEGWKNQDPRPNDEIVLDEFQSFSADGLHRTGRPTRQQMAEQPIAGFKLSELRALPVETDEALVTYLAEIKTPDNLVHHMFVGEAWVKREGQWKIRGFSGTLLK